MPRKMFQNGAVHLQISFSVVETSAKHEVFCDGHEISPLRRTWRSSDHGCGLRVRPRRIQRARGRLRNLWASPRAGADLRRTLVRSQARSRLAGAASNAHARYGVTSFAQQNPVWGVRPRQVISSSSDLPYPCPASAGGGTEGCIRVDVMRGAPDAMVALTRTRFPVFFASMLGVAVRACERRLRHKRQLATRLSASSPGRSLTSGKTTPRTPYNRPDWMGSGRLVQIWRRCLSPATSWGAGPPTGFTLEANKGYQLALKGDHGGGYAGWSNANRVPGCDGGRVITKRRSVGCPDFVPTVGFYAGQPCDGWRTRTLRADVFT